MKQTIWMGVCLSLSLLQAAQITLTDAQKKNWNIRTEKPQIVDTYPLGDFIAKVVTPPQRLQTISLPFDAIVKNVHVARYQKVHAGDLIAEVTGTQWIEIQKQAISDAIEYKHHRHLTERKRMLCKAEIIPKKECIAAEAELKADEVRIKASKALLQSYGASNRQIGALFNDFKMADKILLKSPVEGSVIDLGAQPGKSISPNEALFVIQEPGALWLEVDIEAYRTLKLGHGQRVRIQMGREVFDTEVLQLSPVVNPQNQTRQVRFALPEDAVVAPGLIGSATLTLFNKVVRVKKSSVVEKNGVRLVFVKVDTGFVATPVEILSEDDKYYYLKPSARLKNTIAGNSLSVLKNLLGEEDE